MTIKSATQIAATGVALGLLFGVTYPYVLAPLAITTVTLWRVCQSIHLILVHGSVLFFLLVLASKQKEQT
jgi:hypothetical protein